MKKFIRNSILYGIISILLYVFLICVYGKDKTYYRIGSYGHMYTRIKEIPSHINPEILFIGSSHVYRGFDPRIFSKHGISTFNLGSSAQTPLQTEVLLKKYLDSINPKMVVLEACPMLFQLDGIESTTDLISNDHIDFETCKLAIKSGDIKVMNTLIYGACQEYFRKIRDSYYEPPKKDGDIYISGGFVEKTDYSPWSDSIVIPNKTVMIRREQWLAFEHCVKMLKGKSIPYLLVSIPMPKNTYHSIENQDEINEKISSLGNYIDFNTILTLSDTCFYNSDHLSQSGVCLFNDCFIRVLDSLDGF